MYIQSLEQKRQFEADCAVIIPELDRLWMEKVIEPFGLDVGYLDDLVPTNVVNFRHFLYSYTPQILTKAITRLASRLGEQLVNGGELVKNVSAYYKNIVRDLRRKEHLRWKAKKDQLQQGATYAPGENPDHPNDENLEM